MTKYNTRKDVGYEIQLYDNKGNNEVVYGCEDLTEVAECLISICNSRAKGNFPTVWLDGNLVRF